MTVSVEITHFLESVQEKGSPFFLSFLYCVSRAANQVPELRQRIWKGEIIEYQNCPTSHTVALPDGTYCYCMLRSEKPFQEYLPEAVQAQEAAKRRQSLEDGTEEESLPLLFVSSLPWITYDGIVQPTPSPADSNPRITWGVTAGRNTGLSPGFPSLPPRIGRRSAYGPLLSEFRGGAGTVERIRKLPSQNYMGRELFLLGG